MFDFGSYFRREGDHFGINDKGLVTYDRKIKKDAFYFYKANWSEDPVLHITSSRYIFRDDPNTVVKVYTNLTNVSLFVNGVEFETRSPEKGIIKWENIKLDKGNNGIVVRAEQDGKSYVDDCVWVLESPFSGMNLGIMIFGFMMHANTVAIIGFAAAIFLWFFWIRNIRKRAKFKRFVLWTLVWILIIGSALVLILKLLMSTFMGG
jgi:beta-galactosidase